MADGTVFPAFLKIEHQPSGSAKSSFLAEVRGMAESAQKQFEASFGEIGRVVEKSVASINGKGVRLDLGVSGLRQAASDAELARQKLLAMQDAAGKLAKSTGDTSGETRKYLQALSAQVIEATRARDAAEAQVLTYTRLQDAMDQTVRTNERLRDSYRATYLEQARAENFAHRSQQAVNAGFAPGLARQPKSARDSADVFENFRYAPKVDTSFGVDRLLGGGASLDRAAVSAATLDAVLGRVAQKGPMVAASLEQAAAASQRAAQQAETLAQRVGRLEAEMDPMVAVQQRFNQQMQLLDDAFAAGAIGAERYGVLQRQLQANLQRTTTVLHGTNGALRQATLQAGQQMQDLAISIYSGQNASIVFAQQLPQLAFAMSGLEGSANKTHDRIGRFATFLSGPWGVAVGLAIGVLGTLAAKLLNSEDAADASGSAVSRLKDRLDLTKNSYESLIAVVNDYNKAQERTEAVTLRAAKAAETEAAALLTKAKAQLAALRGSDLGFVDGDAAAAAAGREFAISGSERRVRQLEQDIRNAERAVADITIKGQLDPIVAVQQAADKRLQILEEEQARGLKSTKQYEAEKLRIEREAEAEKERLRKEKRGASGGPGAAAQASLGDMVALVEQLFPGAAITSTTGGRHKKGSDHYAARAIDFVPAGGMGRYSTAEVEEILRDAGVDIRRNAGGTKQIFGPGRSASKPGDHDDHFHFAWQGGAPDPEKVAAAVQRAQQKIAEFGEQSAERIARVNEQFDEQPRLIDRAAQATRQLEEIISNLGARNDKGQFDGLISDAMRAQDVIADALVRPFRELDRESQRRFDVQSLVLQGREAEADALQQIWQIEKELGTEEELRRKVADLTTQGRKEEADILNRLLAQYPALKQNVRDLAQAEQQRTEQMRVQQQLQQAYLDASRSIRDEIEGMFTGRKADFGAIFKQLNAKVLTERLFGDMFRDLDKWIKTNTGITDANDTFIRETERTGAALNNLTDVINGAAGRLGTVQGTTGSTLGAANDNFTVGAQNFASDVITGVLSQLGTSATPDASGTDEIVVSRDRPQKVEVTGRSVFAMTPEAYFDRMSQQMASKITGSLDNAFGTQFFGKFQGVVSGALYGNAVGGKLGAAVGGIQGLAGMAGLRGGSYKMLGDGLQGLAQGSLIAGIGNSLGIGMSQTGAQIGGLLLGPIGGVVGGLLGGLFSSPKWATSVATNGAANTRGNKGDWQSSTGEAAGGINDAVKRLADQFGATIGNYAVSVGLNNSNWHVSTTGRSGRLRGNQGWADVTDFGKDQEAAIAFALRDAIKDGALMGLRAATTALLTKGDDLEQQIQKAVDFEGVFTRLKGYTDPLGASLDTLDKEFGRLKDIFAEAGATTEEYTDLEKLYGFERAKVLKEAKQQVLGSLQSLYDELRIGDNGLSLRDRLGAARAQYDPLAARVRAGDTTAFDDFAEAGRSVLDLTRQINGSQSGYFDFFNELRDLTKQTLDSQQAAIDAATGRDNPFSQSSVPTTDNASVVSAIEAQTQAMVDAINGQMGAVNQNLGALIQQGLAANSNDVWWSGVGASGQF